MCDFVPAGFGIIITEDAVAERAHVKKCIRLNPTLVPAIMNGALGEVVSVATTANSSHRHSQRELAVATLRQATRQVIARQHTALSANTHAMTRSLDTVSE